VALAPYFRNWTGRGIFYAGVQKYLAPDEFAEAILAYQLLPEALVGLAAAGLPWLELGVGLLLVLGFLKETADRLAVGLKLKFKTGLATGGMFRRSSLLLILLQLLLFILVLGITMARGLKIDCGCGLLADRQVGPGAILEDALLLGLAGWLYWREWKAGDRKEEALILIQSQ
jgi:hypothetical protein